MVVVRCGSVMAKASGSSPPVSFAPADVQQYAAAGDESGDGLDAGDRVAEACDHLAGGPAVPRDAVVEDVPEAVPLGGALQGYGDVSSAPPRPSG